MRFFMRWIIIGLPLLWPAIGHAQLMDENAEKPKAEGGDPVGAWMADSTALPVWAAPGLLALIADPTIDGVVDGTLKLKTDSGTYEADYVASVKVKLSASFLGTNISLDSTFVVPRKQEGVFEVKDNNLILEYTPADEETAVRDTLGFTVREDSLFILQDVPLGQYEFALAFLQAEAPLAVMGFAKVEEEPDPDPDPPEPGVAADFNGDGSVDFSDFISFAQNFGRSEGDANFDARFDLSGDGSVDFSDFIAFAQQFGQ
jgi:hypothetical protein